jgi:hypothetical protein
MLSAFLCKSEVTAIRFRVAFRVAYFRNVLHF